MINPKELLVELMEAGISVAKCDEYGKVWDIRGNEIQNEIEVQLIIEAHTEENEKKNKTKEYS